MAVASTGAPTIAAAHDALVVHRAETEAILVTSGVRWQPFSGAALAELPARAPGAAAWSPSGAHLIGRRDLRDSFVVSVDPPG